VIAGLLAVLMSVAAAAEEVRIDHDGLVLNASLEEAGTWPEGPVVLLVHGTLARGGELLLCGTCMDARALREDEIIDGARRSSMNELAERTLAADQVLVF
jgi:sulfur relay (sulfurtransferase) complex TusBCD TusD component (DsrE family)